MRVGLVSPYSFEQPGGVQNHILGLAGWLRRSGHEPAILGPGAVAPDVLASHGLEDRQVTSTGGTWAIRWNGSVARVAGGPATAGRVRRWLDGLELDVLHVHEPVTPSAALWALLQSQLPMVATFHVATPRSRALALAGSVLRAPLARVAVPIAVSPTAATVVRDHLGITAEVIPNGLAVADFAGERSASQPPMVLFLGRLDEPRKGLDVLLAAVPRLATLVGPVDVVVAGPGSRRLPEGVRPVGAPDDDQRSALLRQASVFVAPHLGRESFGLVLAEAMAAGTPVVASDLTPFRDVLTDFTGTRLGRTFAVGDPDDLADAIARTLTGAGPTTEALRARAADFDWEVVGPQVLDAYARAGVLR